MRNFTINGLTFYVEPLDVEVGDLHSIGKHPRHQECLDFLQSFEEDESKTAAENIESYHQHIAIYRDLIRDIEESDQRHYESLEQAASLKQTKTPVLRPTAAVAALLGLTNPASMLCITLPIATAVAGVVIDRHRNNDFYDANQEAQEWRAAALIQRRKLPYPIKAALRSASKPITSVHNLGEVLSEISSAKRYGKTIWVFGKRKTDNTPVAISSRGEYRVYPEETDLNVLPTTWPGGQPISLQGNLQELFNIAVRCPKELDRLEGIPIVQAHKQLENDNLDIHLYCFAPSSGLWFRTSHRDIDVRRATYESRATPIGGRAGRWGSRSVFTGFVDLKSPTTNKYLTFQSSEEMMQEIQKAQAWGHIPCEGIDAINERIDLMEYRVADTL